jgi:hypothetical protein
MPAENGLSKVVALLNQAGTQATHLAVDQVLRPALPPLMHGSIATEDQDEDEDASCWTLYQRAAGWAFGYRVTESYADGRRRVVFEPYFAISGGEQSPPPVDRVADEIVDAWEAIAEDVTASYSRARLQHLLFVRRRGNGRDRARAAVRGYIDAAAGWDRDADRLHDLRIALRLARAVGAADLASEIMTELAVQARLALDHEQPVPGRFLGYIEALSDEPGAPDIEALLHRAVEIYQDPWILDRVHGQRLARAQNGQDRAHIEAAVVQVWLDAADGTAGLIRAGHLKTALQRATALQRQDLIERAAAALQRISIDDLGLTSISAAIATSEEQVEQLIAPIVERADWREALGVFARYGPVTGDVARNREQVAEHASQFVLTSLPMERVGGDGLPRFTPQSDEDRAEMALADQETYQLQTWAPILARALVEVVRKHGIPTLEDLATFLATGPLIDDQLASALARVLLRFWTGDYEGAAFTAAPRIEALARQLVLAVDAGVYQLQRATRPGQYPGLARLLEVLKDRGLDESWYRMMHTVCSNPAGGWNIRNEIGHGFVDDVQAPVAAVLLQALLHLVFLGPAERTAGSDGG